MRLARRYKTLRVFATFLFLVLLSFAVRADQKDRFLFRVAEQVVSVQDLNLTDMDFAAMRCHLPDSVLLEYVGTGFTSKLHETVGKLQDLQTPLGQNTPIIIFLSSVRQLWKLLSYVDGQDVLIVSDLDKGLLKPSRCPSVEGAGKKMRASFRRWLRVEVYLRSRYAQGNVTNDQARKEKRFQSISLFTDSLDKQIVHEDFW